MIAFGPPGMCRWCGVRLRNPHKHGICDDRGACFERQKKQLQVAFKRMRADSWPDSPWDPLLTLSTPGA